MYKYEMHLHSNLTSKCAVTPATEYVKRAVEEGFAGFVLTNHFYRGNTAVSRELPWGEFVDVYAREYYETRKLGEKNGIDVLFGLEEGIGSGKECLIYGLLPEVIAAEPNFSRMPIEELSKFVRSNGGFIACAHPFRRRDYITNPLVDPNPENFDAIEVYNRGNSLDDNLLAETYGKSSHTARVSWNKRRTFPIYT